MLLFTGLYEIHRYLVSGLYPSRDVVKSTNISWQTLFRPAKPHPGSPWLSHCRGSWVYHQREGTKLPPVIAIQTQSSLDKNVPTCWFKSTWFVGQNVNIQPSQQDWSGGCLSPSLSWTVLWSCRWGMCVSLWMGISKFSVKTNITHKHFSLLLWR